MTAGGRAPRIGPGALVVVVGPSGAGKDTLIALARAQCANDPCIVFPRRIVTRPASAAEDHDSVSPAEFDAAIGQGAYAFWWEAHGLKYALSAAIDTELRAGKTVVCNVSRAVVSGLRERYANLTVVLVTAPKDVLLARLAARGRESRGDVAERVDRVAVAVGDLAPDIVIENVGQPHEGAARLAAVLRAGRRMP
ncbi:MAG TPA: phosphonate metabolism protein/1,5-bisphosphokinase (PRPP-forming) PhnN [Xanthobacteraceae bacterium]|jgi:ribose 1,5-bisphosphokinase